MPFKWKRSFPGSANNFDLVLAHPELDTTKVLALLDEIRQASHRGLSLNHKAVLEIERWAKASNTPLKSYAYVLLSNWFLTGSGDRHSMVATLCERLFDELFACRPERRLSSSANGQNHVPIPAEFEKFYRRLLQAQGERVHDGGESFRGPQAEGEAQTNEEPIVSDALGTDRLRARFDKDGLHCEVEGSSRAVADFFKKVLA